MDRAAVASFAVAALVTTSLTFAFAFAFAPSCTIFNGLVADAPDAGVVDSGCPLARWPGRKEGMPDGDGVTFSVVVRAIHPAEAVAVGYDLDGLCTCAPHEAGACVPPAGAAVACDEDGGIDNQGARVAGPYQALIEETINARFRVGDGNVLLRIEGYNGEQDDAHVDISVFRSQGPMQDAGVACAQDLAPNLTKPRFTPDEEWSIDVSSFKNRASCIVSQRAVGYVVGGRLVAQMETELTLSPFVEMSGQSGVITADIVKPADRWQLANVVVAGRWRAVQALTTIGQQEIDNPAGGSPLMLCETPGLEGVLESLREAICAGRDVASLPEDDGKGAPCDALSFALAIDTVPAQLGPAVRAASFPVRTCPPSKVTCNGQ